MQGFNMLLKAFNEMKYLEKLTGLDKLYDEGEAVFESVNWDEEGEDDFWSYILCCCVTFHLRLVIEIPM